MKINKFLKKLPLFILSFIIISGFMYLTFKHYTRFGLKNDVVSRFESNLLDLKVLLRGKTDPTPRVGILAIDEQTIKDFGQWPISRSYYRQALNNLKKYGVSWIGFDATFSEKQSAKIGDIIPELELILDGDRKDQKELFKEKLEQISFWHENSPQDQEFAKGLLEFENIVLGYYYYETLKELKNSGREKTPFPGFEVMSNDAIAAYILPENRELETYPEYFKAYGIVSNIPLLNDSVNYFGFFSNEADYDAIVRWVSLVKVINGQLMPSLSLKTAAEALDRDILVLFDEQGVESIDLISREDESDALSIPVDPFGQGRVLANFRGPSRTIPHYSLADAYHERFTPEELANLKDSVLLFGSTAIGVNDQRPNAFDPAFDGVEIHSTIIDNIITQDFMQRPRSIFNIELMILLVLGLVFAPILIYSSAIYSGVLVFGFILMYLAFDHYYWFNNGTWTYVGMPILEIISLFVVITLYKYTVEEREKRKVKGAFSHYLSPEVISEVLNDPEAMQLGGVKKELTVLFSDVRNFTSISESLTPEQLSSFMNSYFTPMTQIVLQHRGVLDKYIGDAIMAFWGAPIHLEHSAEEAAESALKMLEALAVLQEEFKEKDFPHCDIGIGLNTGPMSVGNMGSDERFCYTVMGDAVNLGSRLEGLTKEYGVKILLSEFTVAKLRPNRFLVRDLDDIRVKGKNEPIKLFQLLAKGGQEDSSTLPELIGLFEQGRRYYLEQNWEQAKRYFQDCLSLYPQDGPSLLYCKRVEEYSKGEYMENWDGVYTFTHK